MVIAKILQNFDSRGSLFQPVWIYEGRRGWDRKPNHSILGLLEFSAPHKINLRFQSCVCACSLENASLTFSCFLTSTHKLDLASLLKERRYLKQEDHSGPVSLP